MPSKDTVRVGQAQGLSTNIRKDKKQQKSHGEALPCAYFTKIGVDDAHHRISVSNCSVHCFQAYEVENDLLKLVSDQLN